MHFPPSHHYQAVARRRRLELPSPTFVGMAESRPDDSITLGGHGTGDRIEQHELEEADRSGDPRIRQPFDEFVRVLFIGSCVHTPPMDRFTLSFYSSAESAEAEREPSLLRISRVICGEI